ncbi:hypothetical protein GCM10023221_10030 [Luteimicrobium xylanilyticum]|uniref:Uncharacterized protein n=1 Tax=Luteimicrobium xylanilyticum TaxID=1133546 RepID=A0A5P9Q5A4_9MICO|nr:hypothetical protein [Luteimicrobium xylanilyticum]QFU96533.1 hypothetical protein KDY119_00017 [Luteimicrobium xylanilyticum]
MSALATEELRRASASDAAPTLVPDVVPATELCRDCGDDLRVGDDALCRWCDDNRARHPEDYEVAVAELPEVVAS